VHDAARRVGTVTRNGTLAFCALLLAISVLGIGRDLWTPDEPREAAISREMFVSPSVVPYLNDAPFLEKPPLYYWTVAGVFALAGGSSAAAARAVSIAAGFLTLLVVFVWGRREFSAGVGAAAALGLATSTQFMISSHWVLIDPLVMLFTTVALWAANRLVRGEGGRAPLTLFYAPLVLALWTKGLIGPVLVGAGLVAYSAATRSLEPLKRLRPAIGVAVILGSTFAFAALLATESGLGAVREWLWVNQVQRFVHATDETGHAQPVYYYLYTLPIAVFPWWVPFGAVLLPRTWRKEADADAGTRDKKVFLGALSLGMAVVLSAASTKRGNYLLPLLPPLFLLLAATASEWWNRTPAGPVQGRIWTSQWLCVALFAAVPVALALAYLRTSSPLAMAFLGVVAAMAAGTAIYARRGHRAIAVRGLGALAVSAVVGVLVVAAQLAAPLKDLSPFVAWVGAQAPADEPIYVLGDFDETIRGIVPFVTGRTAVSIAASDLEALRPHYVLVHAKEGDVLAPQPPYVLLGVRKLGPTRSMALWERRPDRLSQLRDALEPPVPLR